MRGVTLPFAVLALLVAVGGGSAVSAQELNLEDLKRPGKPLVERYTIPGLASEGKRLISRFSEIDDRRVENRRANNSRSSQGSSNTDGFPDREFQCNVRCKSIGALFEKWDCDDGTGYSVRVRGAENEIWAAHKAQYG
ncbi:MAG: hypothetical protein AB1744_14025, partial [Candidatus Zixiibacteriota bacterium]